MPLNFRLGWLSVFAMLVFLAVAYLSPAQVPVIVLKLALVLLAGIVGYWLDRHLFPYARPHELAGGEVSTFNAAMLRRAIVVGATMIAVALGL